MRRAIENVGVLVLKSAAHRSFPREEARALSFTDETPYAILINNKDSDGAKNFSLPHEYAHVLLRQAGICSDFAAVSVGRRVDPIEVFCNQFASAFLVPEREFLSHSALVNVATVNKSALEQAVENLAMTFKVSRYVILRRLLTFGRISQGTYQESVERIDAESPPIQRGGRTVPARVAVQTNGTTFTRQVISAFRSDRISKAAAAEYLGTRSGYLNAVENLLKKHG
ncbi:MAG TPA: ImmA/IrrE family metallo-endopeptidase [Verrucomicrobiae bacterium]|nr:ImmA/IrrE family metallo-endopeptidase [Verrucomicrobiae bacterium]